MGFCSCTAKFILFVFNLVCALLGLAVLGVGVYGQVSSSSYGNTTGVFPIILIVFGSAVTLISFFGCWGAIQENRCFLNLYGSILLVLLIGLIVCGALILAGKGDNQRNLVRFIDDVFDKARGGDEAAKKETDAIQSTMECCGLDGPLFWSLRLKAVPLSCCKGNNNGQYCDLSYAYKEGCETKVVQLYKGLFRLMGVFATVVGSVELLAVFMSFFLAHSIRRQELRSYT